MTDRVNRRNPHALLWSLVAGLLSVGVLYFAFRNLDLRRLSNVLLAAQPIWLIALAVSIPLEQLLRGWKWRQILFDIHPVGTFRLFSAVMVGYFANMIIPIGISPLVRAWLIAGLEGLKISTVLVTTAIERFVDGIVFAILVGILVSFAALPETEGNLRLGMMTAGAGSLVLFTGLFAGLFMIKHHIIASESMLGRFVSRLETTFGGRLAGIGLGIAEGIIWPNSRWRGAAVILASIGMKILSTTHFIWAGLIFGILLTPFEYLFIMIFTGFALIISRFIRVPGGGIMGSAFALKLLGIPDEEALTMVFVVHSSATLLIAAIGAIEMWRSGLTVLKLRQVARGSMDGGA
jgi:uncharacterized membrane protein YbhN (UPF0104 family)